MNLSGLVGGPGVSTFHADTSAGGYSDQDFVDAVELFHENTKSLVSSGVGRVGENEVTILDLATGQPTAVNSVTGFNIPGTASGERCPAVTQGLCEWLTGVYLNGRQIRGKTFMPGPTETFNDGVGVPTSGYVTGLQAVVNAYIAAAPFAAVYSRTHHAIAGISGGTAWNQWAYLRGRRNG